MLKIYLNKANENWILDRLRTEWYSDNNTISTQFISKANIIWICSPWTWKKISKRHLENKKVICSIYHIDESKFSDDDLFEFNDRDRYVNIYHVISKKSKEQLQKYTKKEIVNIPFWTDKDIWYAIDDKSDLKRKYNLPSDSFLIGSFQRDTEGSDLKSPKLSKGPDRFVKIIKELNKEMNLHVILTGKRRNFVINELENIGISYSYFEMVNQTDLNELYNCLDLYIVASRVEGGPQSIIECSMSKTPIISTDVGIASEILSQQSIFNMENFSKAVPDTNFAFESVQKLIKPYGYKNYLRMFENLYEN